MRTTVDLEPDLAAKLRRLARERGVSFKEALNTAVRTGLGPGDGKRRAYKLPTYSLGVRPGIDIDKASHLAAAMEDEEIIRKLEIGK
jgi:hypothetical protein